MERYFLHSTEPLTKTIERDKNGVITKHPYPHVSRFTSIQEQCPSLDAFTLQLEAHAEQHHCLIKGVLHKPLVNESRAGATDSNDLTDWVCLDVDGISAKTPKEFLKIVGLEHLDCIVQYSASHGFSEGLRCHIFALLDKPTSPAMLKVWLKHLNLTTDLSKDIRLSRAGVALRWPLDVTTCQNDKLIYIAPPILRGRLKDSIKKRIVRVHGALSHIALPDLNVEAVDTQTQKALNSLRKAAGLRAYNKAPVPFKGTEIAPHPGRAQITGFKTARNFVYLNLNNGDSWGYYHPIDDHEIIYNFKGEPNYKTQELLPNYYAEKRAASRPDTQESNPSDSEQRTRMYLAFLDRKSDQYHRGVWNVPQSTVELYPTSSLKKLNDFLVDVGELPLENVPEWDIIFDPTKPVLNVEERWVNRYVTPPLALLPRQEGAKCPPNIYKLISHVLCGEQAAIEHFLNWLAVIWQRKCMTGTIWLFTGTFGTGKGLIVSKVIKPLLNDRYVRTLQMLAAAKSYNGWLEESQIVFFDESRIENTVEYRRAVEAVKSLSVTNEVEIEKKYSNSYNSPNYANFIIASNYTDSVVVPPGDRRFNVGAYQKVPLKEICNTAELVRAIKEELPQFAVYLTSREIDRDAAARPLMNTAREEAIEINLTATEEIAEAVNSGDLERLLEQLPADDVAATDANATMMVNFYRQIMSAAVQSIRDKDTHKITREELRVIFEYTCGNMPTTPNKFTRLIKHRGIDMKRIRRGHELARGVEIAWKLDKAILESWGKPKTESKVTPITKARR